MTHDNTSAVLGKFKGLGVTRIHDPRQPVFTLDHNIQDLGDANQAKYRTIADVRRPRTASTPTRPAAASATRS